MSNTENGTIRPPESRFMLITPELAAKWLTRRAPKQRHVSAHHREKLVRDIRAGEWRENGESIKFDLNGYLIDGQHRLEAVIEAGTSIRSLVVRGLMPSTIDTIDTGRMRYLADVLSMQGHVNTTLLAGGLKWWYWYDMYRGERFSSPATMHPSHRELLDYYDAHPELDLPKRITDYNRAYESRRLIYPSVLVWLYSATALVDEERAQEFLYQLGRGENQDSNHPLAIYRERLLASRIGRRSLSKLEEAAYGVKTWNMLYTGERKVQLRWSSKTEPFPVIAGLEERSK